MKHFPYLETPCGTFIPVVQSLNTPTLTLNVARV